MNKISQDAALAFAQSKPFCRSNTAVCVQGAGVGLSLHGNEIANKNGDGDVSITLASWNTVTTRARLNAILYKTSELHLSVVQRDFVPYIACYHDNIPFIKCLMPFHGWLSVKSIEKHFDALINQSISHTAKE